MTRNAPHVSVVVALLNQQATIEDLARRVRETLTARGWDFELVLVDDGSGDDTVAIIRRLEAADPHTRVFELARNFGQAAALACGIFAARGDVIVQMDGDLQNPPEEIPALLDAIAAGAAVATGRRGTRYETFGRWLGSRGIHWLARALTGAAIEDFGGNFKAYRRDVVEAVRHVWGPGKPFFPLALWLGYPVAEVTVRHDPPWHGESRYTLRSLLRINLDLITAFTTIPLALLGAVGLACAGCGALAVVAALLAHPPSPIGIVLAATLLVCGAVFIAAGVLGLYLGRVYALLAGSRAGYVVRAGPARDGAQRGSTTDDAS
jgi:glycosyltransferase involved in cell wall biosynthesis